MKKKHKYKELGGNRGDEPGPIRGPDINKIKKDNRNTWGYPDRGERSPHTKKNIYTEERSAKKKH